MLETYLTNVVRLGPGDVEVFARLLRVHLRGLTDQEIIRLFEALSTGYPSQPTQSNWVSSWDGCFTQMQRHGISSRDIQAVIRYVVAGCDGQQAQQLFQQFINDRVHSERIAGLMLYLMEGPNELHGSDAIPCIRALIGGPLLLRPSLVHEFITTLIDAGLTPTDVLTIQQHLTLHGAGAMAHLAGHDRSQRLIRLATSISEGGLQRVQIMNVFNAVHGGLTPVQVLMMLLELPFRFTHDLLTTVNAPNLIAANIAECNNTFINMVQILQAYNTCLVPNACIVDLFPFFAHVPKHGGSCHTNMISFITRTRQAMITNTANGKSWANVVTICTQFVNAGRRNSMLPMGMHGHITCNIGGGLSIFCNAERRIYFLRAHTMRYCDFSITDRSKDDISFWPGNMTDFNWMTNEISNGCCAMGNHNGLQQICNDATGGNYSCQLVGLYEVGVVVRNATSFTLMHFMPSAVYGGVVVIHKNLLAAIKYLFTN